MIERRPAVQRVRRFLLRLLPFDFRAEFGAEMEAAFEEQRDDVRRNGGRRRAAGLWLRTAIDALRLAAAEHGDLLRQDVRFGARMLLRNPGFTAVVVLTLALGIGAVTAVFAIVDTVVFRPLPFPRADRLVQLEVVRNDARMGGMAIPAFSYPQFEDVRSQADSFEAVAAYGMVGNVTVHGMDAAIGAVNASADLFRVLGVTPVLGRSLNADDEMPGAPVVAVISHGAWVRLYGADPKVLGRVLTTDAPYLDPPRPVVIAGVLPREFTFLLPWSSTSCEAWMAVPPDARAPAGAIPRRSSRWAVVARLKDGVGLAGAQHQLDTIAGRLAAAHPDAHRNHGLRAVATHERVIGGTRLPLLLFLGAVTTLLLIACVNVANLLLARATARQREFALRASLGASRLRVVRQLLTESTLMALAGGAAGLALAAAGVRAFVALSPDMPRLEHAAIDLRVSGFAVLVTALTGLVAGLVPALRCSRRNVADALARASGAAPAGHRHQRALGVLVTSELTLAFVLLVAGGLMVNSFSRLLRADLGFDPRSVVACSIVRSPGAARPPAAAPATPGLTRVEALEQERTSGAVVLTGAERRLASVNEEIERRLGAVPGIVSAGLGTKAPFIYGRGRADVRIEGRPTPPGESFWAETSSASPGYFRTLGIPLVAGRSFDQRDREGAPRVAIISETMARLFWPGDDPIGKRVGIGAGPFAVVVGVVRNGLHGGPTDQPAPQLYYPSAQAPSSNMVVLKTTTAAKDLAAAVTREVESVDSGRTLGDVAVLEELLWEVLTPPRFITAVLSTFSVIALALALIGVHGVMACSVVRRTREIGIRMALGGSKGGVLRLVLGTAMRYAVLGTALGLAGGIAVGHLAKALLFQVEPTDPITLVTVSLLLLGTVVLAAWSPARRATRVEPIVCLREE